MVKLLHVVHDDKFIDKQITRYFTPEFENKVVYLSNKFTYEGIYSDIMNWVKPFSKEFNDLVREAKKYDLVIVYHLNYSKAFFVNQIDKTIPVIWHFFGGEIYHAYKFKNDYFSPLTKKILNADPDLVWKTKILMREVIIFFKEFLTGKRGESSEVDVAIRRADYFLWYDKDEYEHIKQKIPYLPKFLSLPITNKTILTNKNLEIDLKEKKELKVLVGNSNVPTNNHFDVLLTLEEMGYKGSVLLPCSYGIGKVYFLNLKNHIKNLSLSVEYLEEFMPFQEYIQMIRSCSAALFNSYRQMALGNILIFLTNGIKVYLSEKNPSFKWFKNQGFYIYSIERDLKADIKNNNLAMLKEHILINQERYNDMTNSIYKEEFLMKLTSLVSAKKNRHLLKNA